MDRRLLVSTVERSRKLNSLRRAHNDSKNALLSLAIATTLFKFALRWTPLVPYCIPSFSSIIIESPNNGDLATMALLSVSQQQFPIPYHSLHHITGKQRQSGTHFAPHLNTILPSDTLWNAIRLAKGHCLANFFSNT